MRGFHLMLESASADLRSCLRQRLNWRLRLRPSSSSFWPLSNAKTLPLI